MSTTIPTAARRMSSALDQLYRNAVNDIAGLSFREINGCHAAAAGFTDDCIWSYPVGLRAGLVAFRCVGQQCEGLRSRVKQVVRRVDRLDETVDQRAQLGPAGALAIEP
jgi:hypothetical protein